MISKHVAGMLVHVDTKRTCKIFTPGDLVRVYNQPTTVGIVIEVLQETMTLSHCDPPEILKVDVANVMWSVIPSTIRYIGNNTWMTFDPSYVYAPYMPVNKSAKTSFVMNPSCFKKKSA